VVELTQLQIRRLASQQALNSLQEALEILHNDPDARKYYKHLRSSAIQSFEFSIDTLWKFIKEYLVFSYKISIPVSTPKAVFQEAFRVNFVDQQELEICFAIIDARNVTSHTYNERLAEEIAEKLPEYYELMQDLIDRTVL
jgi:nucleotidyltransferase substrate binding protein (TIGR01987 family)